MTRPEHPQATGVTTTITTTYDRRSQPRDDTRGAAPESFDPITVPLDPGITLVEASAGTGKTFCITLTVLRLLLDRTAAGAYRVHGIGNILVVTFTNAATDELITRVRAALRDAVDVFSGAVTGRTEQNRALFELLDRYGPGELPRLRQALAALDQLSVFTIHGFCKRVLEESALESGTPFDAGFLEDDAQLVERVAQDWWRRTVYEDVRLAALAVHEEWKWNAFLDDLRTWQRWPDTRLEPGEELGDAMAVLDNALTAFRGAWDPERTAAFLDALSWRSNAPLGKNEDRRRVLTAGAALARGELAGGLLFVRHCTTDAIRDDKTGITLRPKDLFDRVPDEPCVRACDALADALAGVYRALRVSCLREVDRGFDAEKRRRHLLGFDDLLRRLRDALEREGPDGHLARAIRRRYDAALIDEFQDTDPYQFPIFSTAFRGRPLFLIGDPKQAIYGFRGADVFAYMDAAGRADRAYTLRRNWRSTPRMVRAVNALFGRHPVPFLYDRIPFLAAQAARDPDDALAGDDRAAALHWWFVPPRTNANGEIEPLAKGAAEGRIHATLAREVVRLVRARADGGAGLAPGNIAVLVRTSYEGDAVQEVLRQAGVPSILAGTGDVVQSRELRELEWVLRAVAAPHDARAVRAALTTEMWGTDAAAIHRLSQPDYEHEWQALVEGLAAARETWVRHGFMRMAQELIAARGVSERLLAFEDGERRLTNLRHAVELLHTLAVEERLSPEGVLLRIARARASERNGRGDAERTELRLESDAGAVQIVTVHKSKGLEYDVVFCPGLWGAKLADADEPVAVHLDEKTVVFDHGSAEREARGRLADAERLAEDIRLVYVALTRARLRCYVGWGAIVNGKTKVGAWRSALGYLLRATHQRGRPEDVAERVAEELEGELGAWSDVLGALVAESDGVMSREILGEDVGPIDRWAGATTSPAGELRYRESLPAPEQLATWRISSFTSLTAGRHGGDPHDVSDGGPEGIRSYAEPRRDDFMAFPAGRGPGVALHELFERLDFSAPPADVHALAGEILLRERLALDASDPRISAVAAMTGRVLDTPLPGAGFALRDVPRAVTLREWKFHLPLGRVDRATFATLFDAHGGELARRYVPVLRAVAPEETYGFLTGVVDLAFERDGRWYVVDWKSNHLGVEPEWYEREGMEREMFASQYVLQYHLYVTALHRFLRARLPGYDYERHVGGVWYAFLRGIDGSDRGWYYDRPPEPLIDALDALMNCAGGATIGKATV